MLLFVVVLVAAALGAPGVAEAGPTGYPWPP